MLTDIQARNIFAMKSFHFAGQRGSTSKIAQTYGVSPKTIRDIWAGRTWYRATYTLDRSKPASLERLQTKIGRPLGAKDQQPRRSKVESLSMSSKIRSRRAPDANYLIFQSSDYETERPNFSNAKVIGVPSIDMEENYCIEKFQLHTAVSDSERDVSSIGPDPRHADGYRQTALPDLRVGMEIEAFLQQEQWIPSSPGELDPFHSDLNQLIVFWSHMEFRHCTH